MANEVDINIKATDAASVIFGKIGVSGQTMAQKVSTSISSLGNTIGGEFGQVLYGISNTMDSVGNAGQQMGTKLAAAGIGVAGLGVAMMSLGSGEQAASQQLNQAILATGDSVSDYSAQLEEAVSQGEAFGHSGTDTKNALARLDEATGDTSKSLSEMTLVENIAAAKHESLSSAAQQLALAMNGNSRVFKQFGIDLGTTTPTAQQLDAALAELSAKLQGQASAASDTFDGKVLALKTHLGDLAAEAGEKLGPAITLAGSVALIAGTAMDFQATRAGKAALANAAEAVSMTAVDTQSRPAAVSVLALSAADGKLETSAAGAAVASKGLGASLASGLGTLGVVATAIGAIGLAGDKLEGTLASLSGGASTNQGGSESTWDRIKGFFSQQSGTSQQLGSFIDSTGDASSATDDLASSSYKATAALKPEVTQLDAATTAAADLSDNMLSAAQSSDSFKDSVQTVVTAVQQNGLSLDDNTIKGRANEEAILSAIQAAKAHADAVYKQTGNVQAATTALQQDEAQLEASTTSAGYNKTAIQGLVTQYGALPGDITTNVDLNDQNALIELANLNADLAAFHSNAALQIGTGGSQHGLSEAHGGIVGAAASGGNRWGGVLVGEYGPEVVNLPTGSSVSSHPDTMRMMAGASGGASGGAMTLEIVGAEAEWVALFRKIIRVRGGGNVQKALGF